MVSELLEKAFKAERDVVLAVASCKAPPMEALGGLVGPVGAAITEGVFSYLQRPYFPH